MTEVGRILDQYNRVMNGDAWHGDPVWKILDGISPQQAAAQLHPSVHTIWELVSHMTFWETEVCRRLNNEPPRPVDELNFSAAPKATEVNWNATLAELRRSNAAFRSAVANLDDSQFDRAMPGREKSIYVEVHGVIQHNLYHAGQIALLSKISAESKVDTRL